MENGVNARQLPPASISEMFLLEKVARNSICLSLRMRSHTPPVMAKNLARQINLDAAEQPS
jgi:hypothetical protein